MQHLIGDDPLQSTILVLERTHLRDIADFHAAELGLSLVTRRRANAVTSAELGGVRAGLRFLDDADDLGFRKPGLTHLGDSLRPVAA
jgi:hypothetical protein